MGWWNCRKEPMNQEQVLLRCDNDMRICGRIEIDLCEIIDNDLEWLLDEMGELLISSPCLSEIEYKVVGVMCEGQRLVFQIEGGINDAIEFFDAEDCRAQKRHLKHVFNGGDYKGCCRLCGEK